MTPDSANRLPYIDGLRAVAALLVLLTHTWVFSGHPALGFSVGGHTIVLATIPAVGHVGVNLFLVLSGFCLAWPFFSSPTVRLRTSARQFWTRRVQRIAPAYFVSMAIVAALLLGEQALAARGHWPANSPPHTFTTADVLAHVFFVHNLSPAYASSINGSYWSLALEFQLYFLFPLLLEAMRKLGVWRVTAAVLLLQLGYRLALERAFTPDALDALQFVLPKAVFGRWFDFVAGMTAASVVARVARGERPRKMWLPLSLACLVAAFAGFCWQGLSDGGLDVLWGVGFAGLVCAAADARGIAHRALSIRPLTAIGVMSYSLYLLHQPLMEAAGAWIQVRFRPGTAFLVALGAAVIVIGIAAVFYRAVEGPALRYFAGRRRRTVAAPATSPVESALSATVNA